MYAGFLAQSSCFLSQHVSQINGVNLKFYSVVSLLYCSSEFVKPNTCIRKGLMTAECQVGIGKHWAE